MKYTKTPTAYFVQLEIGDELISSLTDFCKKENVQNASFQGIGATTEVELGVFLLSTKGYEWKAFKAEEGGQYEILSAAGNVTLVDGEPFIHVHGVFGDEEYKTFGGHVKRLVVGATCEVVLTPQDSALERVFDEKLGLKIWNCEIK